MGRVRSLCLAGVVVGAAVVGALAGSSATGAETAASAPLRAAGTGHIEGSVQYCDQGGEPFVPVVTLHHRDGTVAATAIWHGAGAPSGSLSGTVDFTFSEPAGSYYLTQSTDDPIPPADRQIHLHARQTFTTHIDDCPSSQSAAARKALEAYERAAALAAQRAAAQRAAAAQEPKCMQAQVHITTSPGLPSMGQFTQLVSVTNISRQSCALPVYPYLVFHSSANLSVDTAGPSTTSPNNPALLPLVLAQRETATASFGGGDRPIGTQRTCPTYSSFTANIAEGTPVTIHATVPDCSGMTVNSFVAGLTGLYPPTGRVSGRVPACGGTKAPGPGPIVRVTFLTGGNVVSPDFVFASSKVSEPFAFDMAPGRYRVESSHGPARIVVVRTGRVAQLGLFGVCSKATTPTTSQSGAPSPTTVPSTHKDS